MREVAWSGPLRRPTGYRVGVVTSTAASGYSLQDVTFLVPEPTEQTRQHARRAVAGYAKNPDECRELLDMLGLLEEP